MGPGKESKHEEAHVAGRHSYGQSDRRDDRQSQRPEAFGLSDPTACINACKDEFFNGKISGSGDNYPDICRILSPDQSNKALWELYACDSTFCGVANCAVDLDRE